MGSKLLFRFRSGTHMHGLNEEVGRHMHSSRNSGKACFFVSVSLVVEHVLWECSEYSSIRKELILLKILMGFYRATFS